MTEADWTIVLQVFAASRSRRGDKGRDDRRFLEALHYFVVHNITWRALPEKFGHWNSVWKRFWRLSQSGTFEAFFDALAGMSETAHLAQMFDSTVVRAHVSAGGRKRGQDDQALGRSRGGFSTKIHLKVDLGGLPLAFHLTGGEASDSRNFEILLDLGPDIAPRAAITDKGYDAKANRDERAPTRHLPGHSVQIKRDRPTSVLSESALQGTGTHRTGGRQAQALQTDRASMREDRKELRFIRGARTRLHLDQIRPHGLVSTSTNVLQPRQTSLVIVRTRRTLGSGRQHSTQFSQHFDQDRAVRTHPTTDKGWIGR
jgi:transposase